MTDLATLIETRLFGVSPDDQDLVLEDHDWRTIIAALRQPREQSGEWRPIESAPKDGTVIDVWRTDGGRDTVSWGYPPHECGEMGRLCDSDWHRIRAPGWVCSTFGEFLGRNHNPFTHWMPLPTAPSQGEGETQSKNDDGEKK